MGISRHHPPHLYLDDTWYMITSSIYGASHWLKPAGHKEVVRDKLKELILEFKLSLAAWVILDNHYHLLIRSRVGKELPRFFNRLHGATSFELNRRDGRRGRQMWHNYWDRCIRTEKDYWTRFNYIHHNPVKHQYAAGMEDWAYSSYRFYLVRKGTDWMRDVLESYPVLDFTEDGDDF